MKKIFFFSILIILFLINSKALEAQQIVVPKVKAVKVENIIVNEEIAISGSVIANESVELTSVISEKIKEIKFVEGSYIKKNTVLVEFQNSEELAILKQVEAELEESNLKYNRAMKLLNEGNISQAVVDKRFKDKKILEGKFDEISAKIEDLTIKAPFDGIIGTKNFSIGSFVNPGQVIAVFYDIKKVKIKFFLPEKYIIKIKTNQKIKAKFLNNNFIIEGQIFAINPAVNNKTRTFEVIALVKENKNFFLKPGMMVSVNIYFNKQNILSVPEGAIIPEGQDTYVFIVDEKNNVRKKKVKVGIRKKGIIEIVKGLKKNEVVVSEGTNKIKSGLKVELIK